MASLLKLPTRQTSQAQVQSLARFHRGVAELRNLYREKLMELASKMVDRSNLHKELEIADVTEAEDGFGHVCYLQFLVQIRPIHHFACEFHELFAVQVSQLRYAAMEPRQALHLRLGRLPRWELQQ